MCVETSDHLNIESHHIHSFNWKSSRFYFSLNDRLSESRTVVCLHPVSLQSRGRCFCFEVNLKFRYLILIVNCTYITRYIRFDKQIKQQFFSYSVPSNNTKGRKVLKGSESRTFLFLLSLFDSTCVTQCCCQSDPTTVFISNIN